MKKPIFWVFLIVILAIIVFVWMKQKSVTGVQSGSTHMQTAVPTNTTTTTTPSQTGQNGSSS